MLGKREFNSAFNACDCNVFNFLIQESFHFLSLYFSSSLSTFCSFNVSFKCFWTCEEVIKSTSQLGAIFALFDLKYSDLLVFCLLYNLCSVEYIRYLLLQLSLLLFWRFYFRLYVWRCLLIALVHSIRYLSWSCRASNHHLDQYFDLLVFCCWRLFSCQKCLAGFYFVWGLL